MKKNTTEAKVTDGALIVSVANENAPKIWRTDITHANTATFELQDRDDGETALVMRGGDNTEDVYVFADRALALSALYTVQAALFAGDTARNAPTAAKKKGALISLATLSNKTIWITIQIRPIRIKYLCRCQLMTS